MGGCAWMDLDDAFQIRQAIPVGLARARFFLEKKYASKYNTFTCILGLENPSYLIYILS